MTDIVKIFEECAKAFPSEVLTFLRENESEAKEVFRNVLEMTEKSIKQVKRIEEIQQLKNLEMQMTATESWRNFLGKRPGSLEKIGEGFVAIIKRLQTKYSVRIDTERIFGLLDSINMENPNNGNPIDDLIIFNEKPRQLGFVRSPTKVRLTEKAKDRRLLCLNEALFIITEQLLELENHLKKGTPSYDPSVCVYFSIPFREKIPGQKYENCAIELRVLYSIKKIDLNLTYYTDQYKHNLDDNIVLAYGKDSPETKLLEKLFGSSVLEVTNAKYFEDIFTKKESE